MTDYQDFLQKKSILDVGARLPLTAELSPYHFPFQRDIVTWAAMRGRALLGPDCGLGKGLMILELCHQAALYTGKPSIILAPPGVKAQFKLEAAKFGFDVNLVDEEHQIEPGINITNYQRLTVREQNKSDEYLEFWSSHAAEQIGVGKYERLRFNPALFGCLALDEGSILKHFNATTRSWATLMAQNIPYRFVATATPAPNDYMELINYSELLGIMKGIQARAMFFIQDGNSAQQYKIKPWAWEPFWKWVCQWAVVIRKPSDLGYDDTGYILPPKNEYLISLPDSRIPDGEMFPRLAIGLSEAAELKRETYQARCQAAADLVNGVTDYAQFGIESDLSKERWIVWVIRNDEGELCHKLIPDSIEVAGAHSDEHKEKAFVDFREGRGPRVLITKAGIGGLGMNWQAYCRNSVEVSVDHSYEKAYQSRGRIYRFGQEKEVNLFAIAMETEGNVLASRARKEAQANRMFQEVKKQMGVHDLNQDATQKQEMDYQVGFESGDDNLSAAVNMALAEGNKPGVTQALASAKPAWQCFLGDSAETMSLLPDQSVGHLITSVPFPAMYAYTNSERDIGNYDTVRDLCNHLFYVFEALLPKFKPGRIASIHLAQGVAHMNREGYIGLLDFRGPLIEMMMRAGWIFHGERTIEKDPQTERARNQTHGLLFKTVATDAAALRASVSDYLIDFRAPGEETEPIAALLASKSTGCMKYDCPDGWITEPMWINWASNVWYKYRSGMKWWEGVNVTNVLGAKRNTLGVRDARSEKDEKHLCELQLDVIERSIALHSNPGDLVCDPFSGIGSSGFQAILMGRRYVGGELKPEYWQASLKNLRAAEITSTQRDMFEPPIDGGDYLAIHKRWQTRRGISVLDESGKYNDRTEWQAWQTLFEMQQEEVA